MKKLLFKTLFYSIIFIIRVSKKLGYSMRLSIHDVPLHFLPYGGEMTIAESYTCVQFEGTDFNIFLKNYPFPF